MMRSFIYLWPILVLAAAANAATNDFSGSSQDHQDPASPKQGWSPSNEPGLYFSTESGFYPPTASDPYFYGPSAASNGLSLSGLISTGLSIFAGIFMITFTITFLTNFLQSSFVKDLFKGRSLDTDTIADITYMIYDAYQKFENMS